jgi:hypothetical protein
VIPLTLAIGSKSEKRPMLLRIQFVKRLTSLNETCKRVVEFTERDSGACVCVIPDGLQLVEAVIG